MPLPLKGMTVRAELHKFFGMEIAKIYLSLGQPLPAQNMVSLKQAAGVILHTALNPKLRGIFDLHS